MKTSRRFSVGMNGIGGLMSNASTSIMQVIEAAHPGLSYAFYKGSTLRS